MTGWAGEATHWLQGVLPFGIVGILSWSVWLVRRALSHRAVPSTDEFTTSTSVVVPIFHEDPLVLAECLDTWIAAEPDELILVVEMGDVPCRTLLDGRELPDWVTVIPFRHRGKRSALGVGMRAATSEVLVLSDSDTAWTSGLLREIQRPFADPTVGGVGSRQLVAARETSVWRRVASWFLNLRYLDYVPAMGAQGSVPCLSGRTAAYRRSVVVPMLDALEHEVFLGRECVAGDDGRLTWLVLSSGYRTVHQDTACAVSMFPATFRGFLQQRVRWARNSYRCYLTAVWKGWLWRQPFLTQVTVLQIMCTPLTMGVAMVYLGRAFGTHAVDVALAYLAWMVVGRAARGFSHLRLHPRDIALIPLIAPISIMLAIPVKVYAFCTMNVHGWITRRAGYEAPAGQSTASLNGNGVLA
jgi:hyaluronan synthase